MGRQEIGGVEKDEAGLGRGLATGEDSGRVGGESSKSVTV